MNNSKDMFKSSFDKAMSQGVNVSHDMSSQIENYKSMMEVTSDDPYIIKRKFSRGGKEESTEATGSGSSGAYSAPLFSGEEPKKVETKEATGSGSVGAYETPAAWAKSTKKKDWRGGSKPLYKGGKFVSVKKKCTKFPYCNAGDINALDIFEDDKLKEAINSVSKKLGINENVIKSIIDYEYVKKISNK